MRTQHTATHRATGRGKSLSFSSIVHNAAYSSHSRTLLTRPVHVPSNRLRVRPIPEARINMKNRSLATACACALTAMLLLAVSDTRSENARRHTYQTVRIADGIVAFIA